MSAISDFQTIHPSNKIFWLWSVPRNHFFWGPRMAVDFSKKTNWAEPAWAGPSRPEPARGAIGWIFSRFSRKIKNKKDFCRFWEDFQSFSKILLAKSLQPPRASLSPARKPFDFIDILLKSLDFHDFQRIPKSTPARILTFPQFSKNGFHWTRVWNQSFCQRDELTWERLRFFYNLKSDPKTSRQLPR